MRLGALHILSPNPNVRGIVFDPRGAHGSPPSHGRLPPGTGFHAWLESRKGELLDPSVLLTLHGEGYDVDPSAYLLGGGRHFETDELTFVYDELPQMELLGVAESERHLARAVSFVETGQPHPTLLGPNYLDIGWRE